MDPQKIPAIAEVRSFHGLASPEIDYGSKEFSWLSILLPTVCEEF